MIHDWIIIPVIPLILEIFVIIGNLLILAIPFAAGYFVARWRYTEDKQLKVPHGSSPSARLYGRWSWFSCP